VSLPVPTGQALARVVMLGDTLEHHGLSAEFLDWVHSAKVLASSSVVVEWLGSNPFAYRFQSCSSWQLHVHCGR